MPGLSHQNVPQPIAVIAAAVALTFLGLPRRDGGLTAMVDPDASWSDFGFAGAIEGSSIVRKASGGSACSAILAANNSSMSFASAVLGLKDHHRPGSQVDRRQSFDFPKEVRSGRGRLLGAQFFLNRGKPGM